MKAKCIGYIGTFPPPYGGVTIKNKLLYESISSQYSVVKYQSRGIIDYVRLCCTICFSRKPYIIGISATTGKSLMITKLLYTFNRRAMNKSLYFMMGGTESNRIAKSKEELKYYSNYRRVYVETRGMKHTLERAGLSNVDIYPNGRVRPQFISKLTETDKLQCVFFSKICKMKGCNDILDAAERLPNVQFSFYGPIEESYEKEFLHTISTLNNAEYCGLFKGTNAETYNELSKYDVLLFPTKYDTEGVPGIIVEAKISGLAIIASGNSYNAELIEDGVDGIILDRNDSEKLCSAIMYYDSNRDELAKHKNKSRMSADSFFINNYLDGIINELEIVRGG